MASTLIPILLLFWQENSKNQECGLSTLGHADINTNHMYTDISMDLKRKILDTCQAPTSDLKSKTKKWLELNILKWLNELSKGSQLCGVK